MIKMSIGFHKQVQLKPGFHIIARSRKESQWVAIKVIKFGCDSLRSYGNRLKNCLRLLALAVASSRRDRKFLSLRLIAIRCDPLRLMETAVHNFCNSLRLLAIRSALFLWLISLPTHMVKTKWHFLRKKASYSWMRSENLIVFTTNLARTLKTNSRNTIVGLRSRKSLGFLLKKLRRGFVTSEQRTAGTWEKWDQFLQGLVAVQFENCNSLRLSATPCDYMETALSGHKNCNSLRLTATHCDSLRSYGNQALFALDVHPFSFNHHKWRHAW